MCGALALVPHPPFWAVGKKSSLIGSLAVSFTLNIQVKQKSQASLCWQRGELSPADAGPGAPGTWGLIFPEQGLPSLTPPPSGPVANGPTLGRSFCVAGTGAPLLVWSGRRSPAPHPDRTLQSQQPHAMGTEKPQHPNPKPLPPAQYCSLD